MGLYCQFTGLGSGSRGASSPRLLLSLLAGVLLLLIAFAATDAAAAQLPQKTCCPQPAGNGEFVENRQASGHEVYPYLVWEGGEGATTFQVYFGTTNPPPLVATMGYPEFPPPEYGPISFAHDTVYYWRVDAVNDAGTTTGDLWSFHWLEVAEVGYAVFFEYTCGEYGTSAKGQVVDSIRRVYSFDKEGYVEPYSEWLGQNYGPDYGTIHYHYLVLPIGTTTVTWAPFEGFEPPDPPSQTFVAAPGGGAGLLATYRRARGSLSVTVIPETANWIFYPNNRQPPVFDEFLQDWYITPYGEEQTGSQFFSDLPYPGGNMFWRDLPNYDPPEPRVQPYGIVKDQTTYITGIYTRHTGSVEIAATPDTAPWSFTDGDGAIHSGTGDALIADVPTGPIALQWGALAGYDPPEPASVTQALVKDAPIVFSGEYTPIVAPTELIFRGFLPPIGGADATGGSFAHPLRSFKRGSTIPVKFALADADGPVLTGVHALQVIKYRSATDPLPPTDAVSNDRGSTRGRSNGNCFRLVGRHWQFNLNTRCGFSSGTWQLVATLSDGSRHTVWIALR